MKARAEKKMKQTKNKTLCKVVDTLDCDYLSNDESWIPSTLSVEWHCYLDVVDGHNVSKNVVAMQKFAKDVVPILFPIGHL